MKYRTRTFYTNKQKSEMWDRWQRGESMSSIGRHFNRASSSIFPHLAQFGGIRPPARKRPRFALSLTEREEISRGLVAKQSLRSIAKSLNRSPSTISREVRRNGGRQTYRAARSDQRAWDCATRPKSCKLSFNDPLCQLIARKLRRKWSPQQIAGWLIATLVERHSRFVMLAKVENKDTQSVITALIKQARKLPKELYRSLTWDRGSEMAGHVAFTMATKIDVFFCDPQSPLSADCYAIACRAVHGNAVAMKIPTGCFANTSPKALTYLALAKPNSAPSHVS